MAPRPYWKGHIRLSLVSFPVQLHSATSTGGRVQFHQIHREIGRRVRHQKVVPDVGPIENDDIVKGFEVEKDHYVIVEADELDALKVGVEAHDRPRPVRGRARGRPALFREALFRGPGRGDGTGSLPGHPQGPARQL